MNRTNDHRLSVDDLAGQWTDAALQILKAAGVRPISVDLELEAWRTLKHVLQNDLRWQSLFHITTLLSLSTLMEQSLRKTARLVVRKFLPRSVSPALDARIGQLAEAQRSAAVQRGYYRATVRLPARGP